MNSVCDRVMHFSNAKPWSCVFTVVLSLCSPSSLPAQSQDTWVYDDALQAPWINVSWSTSVSFGNTDQAYAGSNAIKVVASAWGALSVHHGSWGSQGFSTDSYRSFDVAVYSLEPGTSLRVAFSNDQGQSFPSVNAGAMEANSWTVVSIPISQLNPNGQTVHRISLQESSGSTKTFYVDEFGLSAQPSATPPQVPAPAAPLDGATDIHINPSFDWNDSQGAITYRFQLSQSQDFVSTEADRNGLVNAEFSYEWLSNGTAYYWRVNATNNAGTSEWSAVFSFTTIAAPPAPTLIAPANGAAGVSTSPSLEWTNPGETGEYRLQLARDAEFNSLVAEQAVPTTATQLTGLDSGLTYYWRTLKYCFTCSNFNYVTDWSEVWSFTTASSSPPPQPGWVAQSSGTSANLQDVCFTDPNTGTAVGDGGTIIRTTDGGETWAVQSNGTTISLSAVSFTDANNGTALGAEGVFRTTDGGTTWTRRDSPSQYPVSYTDASFIDAYNGTIVGRSGFDGIARRTTDGGLTWAEQVIGGFDQSWVYSVSFADANRGIAVGAGLNYYGGGYYYYMVSRTTNGGATWSSRPVGLPYQFEYSGNIPAILYAGTLYIDDLRFVGGPVAATVSHRLATALEKTNEIPAEFGLSQNYPNPFNPSTVINYQLPVDSWMTLKVHNLLGQEVAALVEDRPAGYHSARFEGQRLASGVYIYRIHAHNGKGKDFVQTHRMILVK